MHGLSESELRAHLKAAHVAILGCGGLGSNVAAMLVRSGVGALTLADYDVVEPDNLNRQLYFADQLGELKVVALADTLRRIEPGVCLTLVTERITDAELGALASGVDAVVEAVDDAATKAMIVNGCARDFPHLPLVCASGLAGHGSANSIVTEQLGEWVWVCGDQAADVRDGGALLASRVMVAAAHQAHATIRLLLDLDPV